MLGRRIDVEALELYIKEGESDPETGAATPEKVTDAKKAVASLAEKDDLVKESIEKKKVAKKSTPPPPSLATEPETATLSVSSASKRPSGEESADSRKKAKKSPPKLTKPKKEYVGDRVAKFFDDDDPFFGTIEECWYDSEDDMDLWRIVYDDEDTEDLQEEELLEVLALYEKEKAGDPKKKE